MTTSTLTHALAPLDVNQANDADANNEGKPKGKRSLLHVLMESDDDDDDDDDKAEKQQQHDNHHKNANNDDSSSLPNNNNNNNNNAAAAASTKPPRPPLLPNNNNNNSQRRLSVSSSSRSVAATAAAAANRRPQPQPPRRRRRRRSSAHFLRLTGRFAEDDDNTEDEGEEEEDMPPQQEQLGEMYKRAIRMNAENRINAGNSWGLQLIENIDKFLMDDEEEEDTRSGGTSTTTSRPASSLNHRPSSHDHGTTSTTTTNTPSSSTGTREKRVNFAKASCTLDASVKIYSYRVDDVHLTSYKVLANLNRTDHHGNQKKKNSDASHHHVADNNDDNNNNMEDDQDDTNPTAAGTASSERRANTETLESNVANLNMNKLDSAFDIDPLFHKMSKSFDEGGAKGLLLANLGVGSHGCNIVFDSKQDDSDDEEDDDRLQEEEEQETEGILDITSLTSKLESLLGGEPIESFSLVPQLRDLRHDHQVLDAEGFVNHDVVKRRSRRYASTEEEEKEAEMSIHHEALERSRASHAALGQGDGSPMPFDDSYAAPDFGGGDDDDDDNDADDFAFADFVAADENGARYSSLSFQNNSDPVAEDDAPPGARTTRSATTAALDALCSGDALTGSNDYEFFSSETLDRITAGNGNDWAGAAHWKKSTRVRRAKTKKAAATSKRKTKKAKEQQRAMVDLSSSSSSSTNPQVLEDMLRMPPKSKRSKRDPLQLSKGSVTKYGKNDNLLPPDAGVGLEALSSLFLRPKDGGVVVRGGSAAAMESRAAEAGAGKTVGFRNSVESFGGGGGFDDGGDDSFGDDGPGFAFADDDDDKDDFVVGELEGIRKVDKIQVGYAKVAKKVDVRRLKKDLWTELEQTFAATKERQQHVETKSDDDDDDSNSNGAVEETKDEEHHEVPKTLSFQEAVRDMEASQSQVDVTLPFYFICLLHLANEKNLYLESQGLEDLWISQDNDGSAPLVGTLPSASGQASMTSVVEQRQLREKQVAASHQDKSDEDSESDDDDNDSEDTESEEEE